MHAKLIVFESGFREGDSTQRSGVSNSLQESVASQCSRHVIDSIENFELLHSLLYYIYTDRVCFSTDSTVEQSLQIPVCDAEDVFAIAHRLGLEKVREKALAFLTETCDVTNIISRVFGEFALVFEDVSREYEKLFYLYWEEVKEAKEWKDFIVALESEEDDERRIAVTKRCLELMMKLKSP